MHLIWQNRTGKRIPQSRPTFRSSEPAPFNKGAEIAQNLPKSSRTAPHPSANADTVTLAVPEKIFRLTLILDFFDRGAIKSSLYRPQDALGFYAPKGEG